MQTALTQLAEDFLSTIVFLVIYLLTGQLAVAVIAALMIGVGQFVFLRIEGRTPEVMQWLSFLLVIVLGGATLMTDDSRYVMFKPSVVHFAIAAVMLRRGWMARYLPDVVKKNISEKVVIASGYAWAGLMIVLGVLNIYVASYYSIEVWAWFISVGAVGAKVAAFLLQYAVFQVLIRRNQSAAA